MVPISGMLFMRSQRASSQRSVLPVDWPSFCFFCRWLKANQGPTHGTYRQARTCCKRCLCILVCFLKVRRNRWARCSAVACSPVWRWRMTSSLYPRAGYKNGGPNRRWLTKHMYLDTKPTYLTGGTTAPFCEVRTETRFQWYSFELAVNSVFLNVCLFLRCPESFFFDLICRTRHLGKSN